MIVDADADADVDKILIIVLSFIPFIQVNSEETEDFQCSSHAGTYPSKLKRHTRNAETPPRNSWVPTNF